MLLLIHGYGAGSCMFYRNMKDLAQYFHVFIVDMLGMGSSGRPEFTAFNDVDKCEAFFLDSFMHFKT